MPDDPEELMTTVIPIWWALSGKMLYTDQPRNANGHYVDVRDVARVFVWIVDHPDDSNGERYLCVSGYGSGQAILDILNKSFPERKGKIQIGEPGKRYLPDFSQPDWDAHFDNTKVPKATGKAWIPYDQSIIDSAKAFERYLKL